MRNSTLKDLTHRLMEIEKLSEIAEDYEYYIESASEMESFGSPAFRIGVTLDDDHSFYANIEAIEEELKTIRKYAVGIEKNGTNVVRFDNAHPHANLTNPPHHVHNYVDEKRVSSFDGNIDTMIKEIIIKLNNL